MSMEDDLQNMLKYFSSGKGLPFESMLKNLMSTVEINAIRKVQADLTKMQGQLDKRILELSKARAAAAGPSGDLNPFTILGVGPDATKEEVRKAYKEKAWTAHPDHGGTDEQMMLVNAAREAIFRFKGWKD